MKTCILIILLPSAVFAASPYYGVTLSTATGKAELHISGDIRVAASSATYDVYAATIAANGAISGRSVTAVETLMVGTSAASGVFRAYGGDAVIDGGAHSYTLPGTVMSYLKFDADLSDYSGLAWTQYGGYPLPDITNITGEYKFIGAGRFATSPAISKMTAGYTNSRFAFNEESAVPYSLSFWLKVTDASKVAPVFYVAATGGHIEFYYYPSGPAGFRWERLHVGNAHTEYIVFPTTLESGAWYYCVLQFNGSPGGYALWLNGEKLSKTGSWSAGYTGGINYASGTAVIGHYAWSAAGMDGFLDDLRVDMGAPARFDVTAETIAVPSHPETDVAYYGRLGVGLEAGDIAARLHVKNLDVFNDAVKVEGQGNVILNQAGNVVIGQDTDPDSHKLYVNGGIYGTSGKISSGTLTVDGAGAKLAAPEICLAGDCQTGWPSGGGGGDAYLASTQRFTGQNSFSQPVVEDAGHISMNVETLAGDKTLYETDRTYQFLDPNAANRSVYLSTAAVTAGKRFHLQNSGTAGQNLNIYNIDGTSLGKISGGQGIGRGGHGVYLYTGSGGWYADYHASVRVGRGAAGFSGGEDGEVHLAALPDSQVSYRGVTIGHAYSVTGDYVTLVGGRWLAGGSHSSGFGYGTRPLGDASVAIGIGSSALLYGEFAKSHGWERNNENYWRVITAIGRTDDNTPTEIFLDGTSARLVLKAKTAVKFRTYCVAYSTANYYSAAYEIAGLVKRNASDTTTLVSSATLRSSEERSAWDIAIAADDTNDALTFTATGEPGERVYWHCRNDVSEVTLP